MEFDVGRCRYQILMTPRVKFKEILKEPGTRGNFYALTPGFRQCFLAQSMPPLIAMIRQISGIKLHTSTFYRIVRGEARHAPRSGFKFKHFPRSSVEEINAFLQDFELLIVCSQNLDLWILDPQEDKNGSASPQRTEIQLQAGRD